MEELQTYYQIPSIAHFCNLFRHSLHLPDFDYEDLEFALLSDIPTEESDVDLPERHLILRLICSLLKGYFNTTINHTNWEKYLHKLFQIQWIDIEKKRSPFVAFDERGEEIIVKFNDLPLRTKVNVVHCLCDYRLFADDVSNLISEVNAEEYRVEPLGTDSKGYIYWYFFGTRLYRENTNVAQSIELNYKNFDESVHKRAEDIRRNVELERIRAEQQLKREAKLKKEEERKEKKRSLPPRVLGYRTGLRERKADQSVPNGLHSSKSVTPKKNLSKDESNDIKSENDFKEIKEIKELSVSLKQRTEAWSLVCRTEEDWKDLCAKFEKSKTKCEIEFHKLLAQNFVPKIEEIFENLEKERLKIERQKLYELLPRRVSSRIESKKLLKEKEETIEEENTRRQKEELERRNNETERERSDRIKLERENRAQKRIQLAEERAVRALKRERMDLDCDSPNFDENMETNETNESNFDYITEEFINEVSVEATDSFDIFYNGLELVINAVKSHRDAWPFAEAVDGNLFPMYYEVIEAPIDLSIIERKIQNRIYENFEEIENDFKLMVNNCETFNGPKNGYTLMAYGVWRAFKRAALKHMEKKLTHDESTAFIYPQKATNINTKPAIEAKKKKTQNKRRSTFKALNVLAKAAEKAIEANDSRLVRELSSTTSSSPRSTHSSDAYNESASKLNSCQIHGDMLANFLFNANNSTPVPITTTTPENLTFKSLDEWSKNIKQSGNCIVLPQNAVIISPATYSPVVRPQVSLKVVSTGSASADINHVNNANNATNLFTSSVISNNENSDKELVNVDPKRLVIKLSRCESGQVWRPVTLITSSPQNTFNTITINSNQMTNRPTISSTVQQIQELRSFGTNSVPVNKRIVIQDVNKQPIVENNAIIQSINLNNVSTHNHINPIPQSFQITGLQNNQNSNVKVFRLKMLDQNNQTSSVFQTNSLPTNQSPVPIPTTLLLPLETQTTNENGLSSGL